MKESAPKGGAGSDDPTGLDLRCGRQGRPAGHQWKGVVRTGSSCAERIDSNAPAATDSANSQSERGLDSAERSPDGEPEARASGRREERQGRPKTTAGGRCDEAVPSAGWREVAEALDASGGMRP